jgi:hypothetical protein
MAKSTSDTQPVLPTHIGEAEVAGNDSESLAKSKHRSPLVAGAAYCTVSAAMVLLNKHALSSFDFTCPNTLLLAQCISAVLVVKLLEMFGVWRVEPLRWDIVKVPLTLLPACQGLQAASSAHCTKREGSKQRFVFISMLPSIRHSGVHIRPAQVVQHPIAPPK